MALDQELLDILRCPETHAPLVLDGDFLVSTDPKSRRRYQIEDDIPNMIIEESEVMTEDAWMDVMKRRGVIPAPPGESEGRGNG